MESQIESRNGQVAVTGDMTVYSCEQLKPALLAALPARQWDLSQVQEFDTAGLQLVLLLSRELQGALQVTACSQSVRAALELTHLKRLLPTEAA